MTSSFQNTQWTLVLRASGVGVEAQVALSDLCGADYAPVVAFLRRDGRGDDQAREMAHAFFAGLLEGGLGTPDHARGQFRSYLLGTVKHFLSKHREAAGAQKRGGGVEHVGLDVVDAPNREGAGCPLSFEDDALVFDREWAFTVIARALAVLEREHEPKQEFYQTLKPWLDLAADVSQAQVAATVNDPKETADELRHLIQIVSRG